MLNISKSSLSGSRIEQAHQGAYLVLEQAADLLGHVLQRLSQLFPFPSDQTIHGLGLQTLLVLGLQPQPGEGVVDEGVVGAMVLIDRLQPGTRRT
jgi:hypothetical protein